MTDREPQPSAQCVMCKKAFSSDPQSLSTILIDPETGLPPGMTALGSLREATPEAVARSTDKPICADCVARARQFKTINKSPPTWDTWP